MLPESAKKLREPIAALLLGAAALYLIVRFAQLFKDNGTFTERALLLQQSFVDPVWIVVVVLAGLLVTTTGERTPRARVIVLVALAILGVMALLAIITWLAGLSSDLEFGLGGNGKIAGSFLLFASLAVIAAALLLLYSLFRSLPAPVRQRAPQQWGGQPQQWGGQQPPQWGGQPPAPTATPQPGAGGSWTSPGVQPSGPPPPSQPAPPAQTWGQPAPAQQPSWGQPGPPQPHQSPPGQPPSQPGGATAAPGGNGHPEPPPAPRREDEDDSRPGWWHPGS